MLSRHPRLAVLPETNYFPIFKPVRDCYEPLDDPESLRRLAAEVVAYSRRLPYESPSVDDLIARVDRPVFTGLLAAWASAFAASRGRARGGEKTPRHAHDLAQILTDLPESPILFCVRDPRDCVYSGVRSFKASWPAMVADWNAAISALLRQQSRSGQVMVVRYEDLVSAPEQTLRSVCRHLGESWTESLLATTDFPDQFEAFGRGHERLRGAVSPDTVGGFRSLPSDNVAWVETECHVGMAALGYAPEPRATGRKPPMAPVDPPQDGRPTLPRRMAAWRARVFLRMRGEAWRMRAALRRRVSPSSAGRSR